MELVVNCWSNHFSETFSPNTCFLDNQPEAEEEEEEVVNEPGMSSFDLPTQNNTFACL